MVSPTSNPLHTLGSVQWADLFENHRELPASELPLDLRKLPGGGGVCALLDRQGQLILSFSAQDLRRALARRLLPSEEAATRPRTNLRAVAGQVWWTPTYSQFESALAYLGIARVLYPKNYQKELAFGPAWFARCDPEAEHPRWFADRFAFNSGTVDVGPFNDRRSCGRFIDALEDLFDLCRYHDVLKLAPIGQACAYKEMGRCPAPCDGSISMPNYRSMISASINLAVESSATQLALIEEIMRASSKSLEFERAAHIRRILGRMRSILDPKSKMQQTPHHFRYLVIQRGKGVKRVKPFFIDQGLVFVGESQSLRDVDEAVNSWTDKMNQQATTPADLSGLHRSEHIWLVSHFLRKANRCPGLFIHASSRPSPQELADRIRLRFRYND